MDNERKKSRHNGEGSLERKPNGIYIVRWMKDGKRYSRSTGETDLAKAEERRKEIMHDKTTLCHEYTAVKVRKDVLLRLKDAAGEKTISDFLDELLTASPSQGVLQAPPK